MTTLTRKQQQIRDREREILEVARTLFRERGYLGLNMDRVAQAMRVAKGTIYQHFSCKEEIILAMAVETLERRVGMFEQAAVFPGQSRERLAALGCAAELFVKWYPDHFELEKVLQCESILEKTSPKLQAMRDQTEWKCINLVGGIVRDGIAQGDLPAGNFTPDQIVFGLWSNTYGGYSVMASSEAIRRMGIDDCFYMVRENNNRLLDGYGWRPFSTEHDYHATFERVQKEIFGHGPLD